MICGYFSELRLEAIDLQVQLHLAQVFSYPRHGQNTLDRVILHLGEHYMPLNHDLPWGGTIASLYPGLQLLYRLGPTLKFYRLTPDSAVRQVGQLVV